MSAGSQQVQGQINTKAVRYLVIPSVENIGKGTRKLCSMRIETRKSAMVRRLPLEGNMVDQTLQNETQLKKEL